MFNLQPPEADDLIIPEVGDWSAQKHYYLLRYIDAFTNAMKDKKWSGLHYVDLFAGAGIERLKESGTLEWGSPLIAAQSPIPFSQLHLCELNRNKYEALTSRIATFHSNVNTYCGDANEKITDIVATIPKHSLTLAFLDPYGLHLDYETIRLLSGHRADLIIFFPDHLDVLRNWEAYYWENPCSNLDRFLGHRVNWREVIPAAPDNKKVDVLRGLYEGQLRKLGFTHFGYQRITMSGNRPLYRLIFCTRNKLALSLWEGISQKQHDGQREFRFEE